MSVLIEALCLVVTRERLNEVYSGGAEAFLERIVDPSLPIRYICADDHLVCLSFRGVDDAVVVSSALSYVVGVDEWGTPINGALLDHLAGAIRSYDALEWREHADGFVSCWLADAGPGEMIAPSRWTPERTRRLQRHLRNELHGAICYCYSVAESVWVDVGAGEYVEGYSLEPEKTPEQLAEEYRLADLDDF